MTHSPGPWKACRDGKCRCGMIWSMPNDSHIVTAKGKSVAVAHREWGDDPDMIYGVIPETEQEANTRLIASAPDLLEALERICLAADIDGDGIFNNANGICGQKQNGEFVLKGSFIAELTRAVSAIAKAKGETNE